MYLNSFFNISIFLNFINNVFHVTKFVFFFYNVLKLMCIKKFSKLNIKIKC